MPLDATRWQIDILAADKTAAAFTSATARMKTFTAEQAAQTRVHLLASSNITKGNSAIVAGLRQVAPAMAAAFGGQSILRAADQYTEFTNRMKVAGVASADMEEVQTRLFAAAQRNGVEIGALSTLFSRASVASAELGASQGQMLQFVDGVTAALRLQGGSSEAASGALLQLSQALSGGIVRAEEFNSILEGAFPVAQAAARGIDGMGGSVARLRAAVVEGKVTSQQFFEGLLKGFVETEKQASGMALTVAQATTNLETSWIKLVGAGDKLLGVSSLLATAIGGVAGVMDRLAVNTERANSALSRLPKDAGIMEKLDAIFGGRTANINGLRLNTPAEDALDKAEAAQKRLATLERQRSGSRGINAVLDDEIARQRALVQKLEADARVAGKALEVSADRQRLFDEGLPPKDSPAAPPKPTLVGGKGGGSSAAPKVIDEAAKAAEKLADWMRDANVAFEAYIANEEVSQQALFMSKEAAMALRLETEMLNKAKADDVILTGEQQQQISGWASQMAAASEKTRQMTELFDLAKDVVGGFFTDFMQSLREGQSLFEALGNAGLNALNKIADKLMQMAVDNLMENAFGGGSGGGGAGGFLSGIFGSLFGGGGESFGPPNPYYGPGFAKGGAFYGGNVIPFARGGIVNRPTLFPMASGAGLMGEAGPEAVIPLRRGGSGRLGVDASGMGGVVVNIHNYAEGTKASAKQSKGAGGEMQIDVIVAAVEGKIAGRMQNGQGSLGRTIETKYGLQAVGR